jgi:type III secretory pathway component EscU
MNNIFDLWQVALMITMVVTSGIWVPFVLLVITAIFTVGFVFIGAGITQFFETITNVFKKIKKIFHNIIERLKTKIK